MLNEEAANIIPKAPQWKSMSPKRIIFPIYKGEIDGQTVAIKVVESHANEHKKKCFDNEINRLKSLSHDHIIKILRDKNERPSLCQYHVLEYFVLEYTDKGDLLNFLEREEEANITWSVKLHILSHISKALAYMHRQGITHADVKPENIMQFEGDVWKLIDLGFSRSAPQDGSGRLLNEEDQNGTHAYIAPEICKNELGLYSTKVDIFSLAMVMYVLAEFMVPAMGAHLGHDNAAYLERVLNQDLRPDRVNALKFPQYNTLMCKMWDKFPANRPLASEVEKDIESMKLSAPRL